MEHIKRKIDRYFKGKEANTSFIYQGIPYGDYCYADIDHTCRIYCRYCGDKCELTGIKKIGNIKTCKIHKGINEWNLKNI